MDVFQAELINYFIYFGISLGILVLYACLYMWITPYDELLLIRQGYGAAAVGFVGTMVGFSLTLAASAIYHTTVLVFVIWAAVGMAVQLLGYFAITRIIGNVQEHIEQNNMAVASVLALTGLVLGILNAGCLS